MWPWIVGTGIVGGLAWLLMPRKASTTAATGVPGTKSPGVNTGTASKLVAEVAPIDPFAGAIVVTDDKGVAWLVAPNYIGPIGINEAAAMAKAAGGELPSPALVDAIWRAADLKLPPKPRNNVISQAVFDDQKRVIQEQIGNKQFRLLGGTFKDVVAVNGHPEIYGWHVDVEHGATVPGVPLLNPKTSGPGKIIQPQSGSRHDQPGAIGFKDYSQGLRFVKRA